MVLDDQSPDGTGGWPTRSAANTRAGCQVLHRTGPARPGRLLPRRLSPRDPQRRRLRLPDGRRPVARSEVPARHDRRGRGRRRSRDRLALPERHQRRELAAAPDHPELVRQLLHPHRHRPAAARHHHRLSLLAARGARHGCRSTASSRTATRSCSTSRSWPPTPGCGSSSRRSSSSSAGRARRSCRAAC